VVLLLWLPVPFSSKRVVVILFSVSSVWFGLVFFFFFLLLLVKYLTIFGSFLPGAVGHHGDSLAEKILSVLPQLPGHKTDVMVNMAELTALQTADGTCSIIAPGCLAQPK